MTALASEWGLEQKKNKKTKRKKTWKGRLRVKENRQNWEPSWSAKVTITAPNEEDWLNIIKVSLWSQ